MTIFAPSTTTGMTWHLVQLTTWCSVPIENVYSVVTFFLVANKHRQAIAGTGHGYKCVVIWGRVSNNIFRTM